jgi:hypothetical protein
MNRIQTSVSVGVTQNVSICHNAQNKHGKTSTIRIQYNFSAPTDVLRDSETFVCIQMSTPPAQSKNLDVAVLRVTHFLLLLMICITGKVLLKFNKKSYIWYVIL